MEIRKILPADNLQMAAIVRNVLMEMGAPTIGTAYADPNLDTLHETYNHARAVYYVLVNGDTVVGGAGVSQLENAEPTICEFQKMYFLPEARGLGFARKILDLCLQDAISFGYKKCYIETMPYMHDAQKLYKNAGFYNLDNPLGNTGHTSCEVWMMKDL
ncbi:MAG: GNAT family N-acetyltransferase [Ferruginibacter sp.]|nr:GNAT family N-acetyltransferase [Ferruginibacter sp.]